MKLARLVPALPSFALGIDVATGAAHRLEPSKIFLLLEPEGMPR